MTESVSALIELAKSGTVRGTKMVGAGSALEHVSRTEVVWTKEHRASRTLF